MNDEERRELIARQRSALYGEGGASYPEGTSFDDNGVPRPTTQGSGRGQSPLTGQQSTGPENGVSQTRSRANSNSSPASNPTNFGLFENAQQSSRTSNSSPGGSPPRQGKSTNSNVAPIGTRPAAQAANPALTKQRSTTPLPSPLSYGFAAGEEGNADRTTSAASNPSSTPEVGGLGGWGSKSGVWGKNSLGVQASVWG